jgi:hypothetical protein
MREETMKTRKINLRKARRGSILALVLIIGVCLAFVGWGMLQIGFGGRVNAVLANSWILARSGADAGLTDAIYKMNVGWANRATTPFNINNPIPAVTNVVLPNSNVKYSYNISHTGLSGEYKYQIESIGTSRDAIKKVYATTRTVTQWVGIGVQTSAQIHAPILGVIPEGTTYNISIRTNSTAAGQIYLQPNSTVPGDIIVGPGGDPTTSISIGSNSTIQGDTYAASEKLEFPDNIPPTISSFSTWKSGDQTISTGSYKYKSITIDGNVKIQGDVTIYATQDVVLKNGAVLDVNVGSLKFYVDKTIEAKEGSWILNDAHDATKLTIYGTPTCTSIILKNSGNIYGLINAPQAALEIKNSGSVYGGFIGYSLEMKNTGAFYFDTRLISGTYEPTKFVIERWWED